MTKLGHQFIKTSNKEEKETPSSYSNKKQSSKEWTHITRLIDWLTWILDCPIDWLIDWSTSILDWPIDWLIDWLIDQVHTSLARMSSIIFSFSNEQSDSNPTPRHAPSLCDSEDTESADGVGEQTLETQPVRIVSTWPSPSTVMVGTVSFHIFVRFSGALGEFSGLSETSTGSETVSTLAGHAGLDTSASTSPIPRFPFWISSFFMPASKHFFSRHCWHHRRDSTSMRQTFLKGHLSSWKSEHINQSINQSINRTFNQSIEHSIDQSCNRWINQPINRPIIQSKMMQDVFCHFDLPFSWERFSGKTPCTIHRTLHQNSCSAPYPRTHDMFFARVHSPQNFRCC